MTVLPSEWRGRLGRSESAHPMKSPEAGKRVPPRLTPGLAGAVFLVATSSPAKAETPLPPALSAAPDTAVAVHAPRLREVLATLAQLGVTAGRLRPELRRASPTEVAAMLMWGVRRRTPAREKTSAHGLDLDGAVGLRLSETLETAIVTLPIRDALEFRAWLRRLPAPDRMELELLGTPVDILAPDSRVPVACAVMKARAVCQIGVAGRDSLGPLEAELAEANQRATPPSWAAAWRALPPSDWTAVIRPDLLASAGMRLYTQSSLRSHRFHDEARHKALGERLRQLERMTRNLSRQVHALALGVQADATGSSVTMVAQLTPEAGSRLRALSSGHADPQLRRWASTPALLSLFMRGDPSRVAELARRFGVKVDPARLDGGLGLLALGLDLRSPQALGRAPFTWQDVFPSAIGVALRRERAPGLTYMTSSAVMPVAAIEVGGRRRARPPEIRTPTQVIRSLPNVQTAQLERHVVAGTGPGGLYAALRRWRTARASSIRPPHGFFFATLDLSAIDAAFEAERVGPAHRAELRLLDQVRRRVSPMLRRVHRVRIVARQPRRTQLEVQVSLGL